MSAAFYSIIAVWGCVIAWSLGTAALILSKRGAVP